MNDELLLRVLHLEQQCTAQLDAIVQLREVVSDAMGAADADSAVVTGLMMALAANPNVQVHVNGALESRMASILAMSLNQPAVVAFEKRLKQMTTLLEEASSSSDVVAATQV